MPNRPSKFEVEQQITEEDDSEETEEPKNTSPLRNFEKILDFRIEDMRYIKSVLGENEEKKRLKQMKK